MNNQKLILLLKMALSVVDKAEQLCPKPVMSTPIGVDIAAAHHSIMEAYKKAIIDK